MKAIPQTPDRERLAPAMDEVVSDETGYLMSSPVNAARLNEAIRALESGLGVITRDAASFLGK